MNLAGLSRSLVNTLGTRVRLSRIGGHVAVETSDVAMLNRLADFRFDARKQDWLRGRAALAALCSEMGMNEDPVTLCFPHPTLSLTHAGDLAFAVGSVGTDGIGVDFEPRRPVRADMARWFLTDEELCLLDGAQRIEVSDTLLRIWTIKEAVYKACPCNEGLLMRDISLHCPADHSGSAVIDTLRKYDFRYSSHTFEMGFLSVAVARRRERHVH